MTRSYCEPHELEEELREALRRLVPESAIVFETSTADYFRLIEKRYPIGGSKVDWRHVPTAKERDVDRPAEHYLDEALAFTEEILVSERFDREREVVVLDDGDVNSAMRMSLSTFVVCIHEILKNCQHTYVMPTDASWLLVYTMEGNLNFGYAPP